MPSVSSLLKSAAASRRRIAEQQDAQVAFDWSQSAKTYEDFVDYQKYLEGRRTVYNDDPSKLLTIDKTIAAARRAYTSNEIQRQNISIVEGKSSPQDKYNAMVNLFYQAVDNGDYDLAQTLNLQLDNLSVKIQQAQQAQANAFSAARASGAKSVNDLIKKLEFGAGDITLADGSKVTSLADISRDLIQTKGSPGTWAAARDTVNAIRNLVIEQYQSATTQDEIDKLEQKYGAGLIDIDKVITFKLGEKNLSAEKLETAYQNELINNPVYSLTANFNEATGKNEYSLKENNVQALEYTRQYDPNTGEEYFAPTQVRTNREDLFFGQSDQGRGINTQITNEGEVIGSGGEIRLGTGKVERDETQTIGNRLRALGIENRQYGTTLKITLPGDGVERTASIQDDGTIRYFDDNGKLIEIGLVDRPNFFFGKEALPAGQAREVSPEETSDFAEASDFGTGYINQRSARGQNYLENFQGRGTLDRISPVDLRTARLSGVSGPVLTGPINTAMDFSGVGSPVSSALLQSAKFTQGNVAKEQAAKLEAIRLQAEKEAAQRLQSAGVFNLNQTPVAAYTSGGAPIRQLKVKPLPPAPRVRVAPPAPTPRITNVGVAPYRGSVRVGNFSGGLQGF